MNICGNTLFNLHNMVLIILKMNALPWKWYCLSIIIKSKFVLIFHRFTYGLFYKPVETPDTFAWRVEEDQRRLCGICQKGIGEMFLELFFFHFTEFFDWAKDRLSPSAFVSLVYVYLSIFHFNALGHSFSLNIFHAVSDSNFTPLSIISFLMWRTCKICQKLYEHSKYVFMLLPYTVPSTSI